MMKQAISIILLFAAIQTADGQIVLSSCLAPDSVKAKYKEDAERLALRMVYDRNLSDTNSIHIPNSLSDSFLNALLAVYNATSLPARDTVTNIFNIHTFPDWIMNVLIVYADSNLSWMHQLRAGNVPTGYHPIDSLLSLYNLHFEKYWDSGLPSVPDHATFNSDTNYNMLALGNVFELIPGVYYAFPYDVLGDGGDLTATMHSDHIQLTYIYKWGWDCPSGCSDARFWIFNVYNDCSVEFVESHGSVFTSVHDVIEAPISVTPNPFKTFIRFNGIKEKYDYSIIDLNGRVLTEGETIDLLITNLDWLKSGLYFIKIQTDNTIRTFKLMRE